MKHLIIYIIVLLFSITVLSAQNDNNRPTHQAGFNAGTFFGVAPTYRYNTGKNGIQVSALPIFTDGELTFNGSLGYLRSIASGKDVDFSFVTALVYGYTDETSFTAISAGTQIELKLGQFITAEGRAGFLGGTTSYADSGPNDNIFSPSIGVALMYNFR